MSFITGNITPVPRSLNATCFHRFCEFKWEQVVDYENLDNYSIVLTNDSDTNVARYTIHPSSTSVVIKFDKGKSGQLNASVIASDKCDQTSLPVTTTVQIAGKNNCNSLDNKPCLGLLIL